MKLTIFSLLTIVVVTHAATFQNLRSSLSQPLDIEIEAGNEDILDIEIDGKDDSLINVELLEIRRLVRDLIDQKKAGKFEQKIRKANIDDISVDKDDQLENHQYFKKINDDALDDLTTRRKRDLSDIKNIDFQIGNEEILNVERPLRYELYAENSGDDGNLYELAARKSDLPKVKGKERVLKKVADRQKRGILNLDILGSGTHDSDSAVLDVSILGNKGGSSLVNFDVLGSKRHSSLADVDIHASKASSYSGQQSKHQLSGSYLSNTQRQQQQQQSDFDFEQQQSGYNKEHRSQQKYNQHGELSAHHEQSQYQEQSQHHEQSQLRQQSQHRKQSQNREQFLQGQSHLSSSKLQNQQQHVEEYDWGKQQQQQQSGQLDFQFPGNRKSQSGYDRDYDTTDHREYEESSEDDDVYEHKKRLELTGQYSGKHVQQQGQHSEQYQSKHGQNYEQHLGQYQGKYKGQHGEQFEGQHAGQYQGGYEQFQSQSEFGDNYEEAQEESIGTSIHKKDSSRVYEGGVGLGLYLNKKIL